MQSQTVHDKMMKIAEIRITEAVWPEDRAPIARLMREYVEALEADISFQDFESEHAGLPGKYARPEVSFSSVGRQMKPSGSLPIAPSNAVSAR